MLAPLVALAPFVAPVRILSTCSTGKASGGGYKTESGHASSR